MIQVAGTLIIQNGEYVLQHRDDKPDIAEPGTYSLWGGRLEEGETPIMCVKRELYEETNIRAHEDGFIVLCDFLSKAHAPEAFGEPVHVHIYAIEIAEHITLSQTEGQGIVRLKPGDPLPEKLTEYARKAIGAYEVQA